MTIANLNDCSVIWCYDMNKASLMFLQYATSDIRAGYKFAALPLEISLINYL